MKLSELIKSHHFDEINRDIAFGAAQFVDQEIRVEEESQYELLKTITPQTSYTEVLKLMEENSLIPANIYELLNWKGWDEASTVIAIGSVTELDGKKYVPCVSLDHFRDPNRYYALRRLCLLELDREWKGEMSFLAIRGFKK